MNRFFILLCLLTFCAEAQSYSAKDPLAVADSLFMAGNYQLAAPQYERALKTIKAPAAQTLFRLGFTCHNMRDYNRALEAYRKAEKINPRVPGLRVNMAKVFSASGDTRSAAMAIDSAITQGFGNHKLLENDPEFANLRKDAGFIALRDRAYAASHPCENLPAARNFDFWLGEWNVVQTANPAVTVGSNNISRRGGGCIILEDWESQGAHSGMSINYFDPTTGKWNQKWAGSGQDFTDFYDGEFKDHMLRFKFDIPPANGVQSIGRLTFTDQPNGHVRQHSEQSTDGGRTWQTLYDFTYIRK